MKKIKLLNSEKCALVDDDIYCLLKDHEWRINNYGYAKRKAKIDGKWVVVLMHRIIMQPRKGEEIDHINRDRLDNRRSNLRSVTRQQNSRNSSSNRGKTYKGTHWYKSRNNWQAYIGLNGKNKFLGYFKTEKEAAIAYNKAAKSYFGEYACLNVISE